MCGLWVRRKEWQLPRELRFALMGRRHVLKRCSFKASAMLCAMRIIVAVTTTPQFSEQVEREQDPVK